MSALIELLPIDPVTLPPGRARPAATLGGGDPSCVSNDDINVQTDQLGRQAEGGKSLLPPAKRNSIWRFSPST